MLQLKRLIKGIVGVGWFRRKNKNLNLNAYETKIKQLEQRLEQQEKDIQAQKQNIEGLIETITNITITLEGYGITLNELLKQQQNNRNDFLLN